MIQPINKKPQK